MRGLRAAHESPAGWICGPRALLLPHQLRERERTLSPVHLCVLHYGEGGSGVGCGVDYH
ncbi:hypothetical protein IRJ41_007684 [Triplophysa rosa]|uniref:Uncharacterized protein n=1 Tax=Triplophysa rosa TaxID=992332 RepID=A0A9W8C111_TRIRA|nr:hypothetical protein IRJ41_007684 [Triplophysa rosa]